MQRKVRLALMVGAVAHQTLTGLLGDPPWQQFPSYITDVHLGDEPIILTDIALRILAHSVPTVHVMAGSA